MNLEITFRKLIGESNPSWKERGVLAGLAAAAVLVGGGARVKAWLHARGWARARRLARPVVSVGNLTLGGTGKTPIVEMLAREMGRRGRRVAVLTRGYGRVAAAGAASEPQRVEWAQGSCWREQAERWGDEPLMLARELPQAAVVVGKNRVRGGQWAIEKCGADLLILDDGYQYLKLERDVNLLVVDAGAGFGNGRVFPRGWLREPLTALGRATAVIFTKGNGRPPRELEEKIRAICPKTPFFYCETAPQYYEEVGSGRKLPPEGMVGKTVLAFSGIARPENFEKTLSRLGAKIVGAAQFPDHHYFAPQEIEKVLQEARAKKVSAVVTTEKDAMRLPAGISNEMPIFFLKISAACPELLKSKILSNI